MSAAVAARSLRSLLASVRKSGGKYTHEEITMLVNHLEKRVAKGGKLTKTDLLVGKGLAKAKKEKLFNSPRVDKLLADTRAKYKADGTPLTADELIKRKDKLAKKVKDIADKEARVKEGERNAANMKAKRARAQKEEKRRTTSRKTAATKQKKKATKKAKEENKELDFSIKSLKKKIPSLRNKKKKVRDIYKGLGIGAAAGAGGTYLFDDDDKK